MLDVILFIYANGTLTAVLTIGAWIGAALGAAFGAFLACRYMRADSFVGASGMNSHVRAFLQHTVFSAALIVVAGLGVVFGSCVGAAVLFVAWAVLPWAIIGGIIGLTGTVVIKRMKAKRVTA